MDIGLHEDGLVHLSHMSMKRISHPSECVAVNDIVKVWVYQIDEARNRVQLSLLPLDQLEQRDAAYRHRKASGGKHNNQRPKQNKPIKKEVSMDDALARLKERFGK